MQNFKRVVASVMATAMLASCAGMTTFAQSGDTTAADDTTPEYKVTITHPLDGKYETHKHTYAAFQIFAGTVDATKKDQLFNIEWGDSVTDPAGLVTALVRLGNGYYEDGTPITDPNEIDRYAPFTAFSENEKLQNLVTLAAKTEPTAEDLAALAVAKADSAVAVAEVLQDQNNRFTEKSLEMYKFAKVVRKYVSETPIVDPKEATYTEGVTTDDNGAAVLTLETPGYYMFYDIDNNDGGVASTAYLLKVVDEEEEIVAKVDKPTLDKYILEGTDEVKEVKVNTASIGDTIHYRLKSKVPNMVGYNKYFFNISDTLDETLDFQEGTVKVKIVSGATEIKLYDSDAEDTPATAENFFYVTADSYYATGEDGTVTTTPQEQNIKIVLEDFIKYRELDSKQTWNIIVEYDAVLMENARIGDTYTDDENNEANVNTAKLIYSNDPNANYEGDPDKPDEPKKPRDPDPNTTGDPGEPGDPTGETPESMVATFTTEIDIFKVDNNGKALEGAEFKIEGSGVNIVVAYTQKFDVADNGKYYKLKTGTFTETAPTEQTKDKYESTTEKYELTKITETKESKDAEGNPIEVKATVGKDGILKLQGLGKGVYTITETVAPAGYNKLKDPIIVNIDATTNPQLYSVTWKFGTDPESSDGVTVTDGIFSITVENTPGATLPGTGSIGTIYFYIVGSLLMAGAVVLFIIKKRSEAKEG